MRMPSPDDPWLHIPLDAYEGHMRAPVVAQLAPLADAFAEALALTAPASVAVLGVAGGNGLDAVDPRRTRRVVGIDLNQAYLDATRERHAARLPLELHCANLCGNLPRIRPVDMVHAALIFEHTGLGRSLEHALDLVGAGGSLSVVLQLAGAAAAPVAETGFDAIRRLEGHFTLVDPELFSRAVTERSFRLAHQRTRPLPSDKALWCAIFTRAE